MKSKKMYVYYESQFFYGKRVYDIYDPPLNNISPNYYAKMMRLHGVHFKYT